MKTLRMASVFAVIACGLVNVESARAVDISGVIGATLTIFDDSQLVGNVTCTVNGAACIQFGAPDIKLRLNGFSITGQAPDPCAGFTSGEDGIVLASVSQAAVLGPGLVQRFRNFGIRLSGSTNNATVKEVTSARNCRAGILLLSGTFDNEIRENVSVGNSVGSGASACGGICLVSSNGNRIRRNETGGNGAVVPNNDFGIGLTGASSGNAVEENGAVGNTNGILIQATATNNVIRRNIITGNPAAQVSVAFPAFGGVDIQDLAANGANTFEENLCLTYSGASPSPCSNLPKFSGHHNTSQGSSSGP